MLILFLYLILSLMSGFYIYVKYKHSFWKNVGVNGPKPKFLVGQSSIGLSTSVNQMANDVYNQFYKMGKIIGIYFWTAPAIVVSDLDLLKTIFITDFDCFMDRGIYYNEKDDPVSAHLFALDGEKWRNLRRKLSPTFTSGKIKMMFPVIVNISKNLQEATNRKILQNPEGFNVKSITSGFTTDVIGNCAFGVECNSLTNSDNLFNKVTEKGFSRSFWRSFRKNLTMTFPSLARKCRLTCIPEEVNEFYLNMVNETINHRESTGTKRNDFMDLLIDLKNNPKCEEDKITMNEIAAQTFIFFLAGFETSSSTMLFCLYELAKNPDIQEKLRKTILEELQKHNNELTYESLQNMSYLDQVIKETHRKYPPLSVLNRVVTKNDYSFADPKVTLKKGTLVLIPNFAIHRDPEIYENPDKFDPNRFTPEEISKRHPYAYFPFGEGPRICIGMRFGLMQTKIGLIALLSQFEFLPNESTPTELELSMFSSVTEIKSEVFLKVRRI